MKRAYWIATLALALAFLQTKAHADQAPRQWGTGFAVDRAGDILTARHVVNGCTRVDIVANGARVAASVAALSADADLALVRAAEPVSAPVAFDSRARPKGTLITVLGTASLGDAAPAILSNAMLLDARPGELTLVSDAEPGASGSPVIDTDGLVIGVLVLKRTLSGGVESALPRETRLAVDGETATSFLRANGVAPSEGDGGDARVSAGRLAASSEVRIDCY